MLPFRIIVSVPSYHSVEPMPFFHFLLFAQETGRAESAGKYSTRFMVGGPKATTAVIRNCASGAGLKAKASHLMLIDDDMIVPADIIPRLLAHNVDIVAPLFFKSIGKIEPLVFTLDANGTSVPMRDYPEAGLFECPGGVGTGLMLIRREVLEALAADSPIWRYEQNEDLEFCKRAMKLGFKCWCDSSFCVSQMGASQPIGEDDYKRAKLLTGPQ